MGEHVEGGSERQDLCGLETWFTRPGSRAMVPPPRWKMAVVTFIGVFFTSNVIARLVGPFVHGLPALAASAVGVAISVVCLTWLVMPTLSRLFRPWLAPLPITELRRANPS